MAVPSDPQDLQIDPATFDDPLLVPLAERLVIIGRSGGDVDVLLGDVDVLEQILVHEVVVALRMPLRQTHVLVQVEGGDLREIQALILVESHQFLIQPQRGGAGSQAQHGVRFGIEHFANESGQKGGLD